MTSSEEPEPHRAGDAGSDKVAAAEASGLESESAEPLPEKKSDPVPERPASFVVRCPECGAETVALAEQAAKRGRCAVCGGTFLILPPPGFGPLPGAENVPEAPPFEGPPHRAQKVFKVGFAAILSTAIATVITGCCAYLPVDIVGLVIGLVAASMGRHDLKAMDRGEMDPAGRDRTRLGYMLGLAAAGISTAFFLFRFGIIAMAFAFALGGAALAPPPPPPAVAPAQTVSPATAPPIPEDKSEAVVPPDVQGLPR